MSVCLPCRQYCYRRLAQRTKSTAAPRLESVATVASLRYFSDAAIAVSQNRSSSRSKEQIKRRGLGAVCQENESFSEDSEMAVERTGCDTTGSDGTQPQRAHTNQCHSSYATADCRVRIWVVRAEACLP